MKISTAYRYGRQTVYVVLICCTNVYVYVAKIYIFETKETISMYKSKRIRGSSYLYLLVHIALKFSERITNKTCSN